MGRAGAPDLVLQQAQIKEHHSLAGSMHATRVSCGAQGAVGGTGAQSVRLHPCAPARPVLSRDRRDFSTGAMAMTAKMVAVGYAASLPITEERALFEFETPVPQPGARDLLVRVQAVSVNPVDVKSRMRRQGTDVAPLVLGWDAAGTGEAVGASCSLFK